MQPMNQEQRELIDKLTGIFFRRTQTKTERLLSKNTRLVHYPSAAAAVEIIKSGAFWLRETRCMSDFREVRHGYELLVGYFNHGNKRAKFCAALDKCAAG